MPDDGLRRWLENIVRISTVLSLSHSKKAANEGDAGAKVAVEALAAEFEQCAIEIGFRMDAEDTCAGELVMPRLPSRSVVN